MEQFSASEDVLGEFTFDLVAASFPPQDAGGPLVSCRASALPNSAI